MSWTAVSYTHTHTHSRDHSPNVGPLRSAPDPRGPSWLRSLQPQPGGSGEKFTRVAVKHSFPLSLLLSKTEIQDEALYVPKSAGILWRSCD